MIPRNPQAMTAIGAGTEIADASARRLSLLRVYSAGSATAVIGIGGLVLLGWEFRIEFLKTVLPGFVTMKANTALCLMMSGTSLLLLQPGETGPGKIRIARALAALVVLIGAASLSQYLSRLDLGIDQWLFDDPDGSYGTSSPGRMAPPTATAFVGIGAALMLMDWETRRGHSPAQSLSLLVGLIAMLGISGYIYHATALTRILLYTQIAIHTAIGLLLLSSAVFFARPHSGIAADLTGEGSGSVMARRLLPAIFSIPIVLGWIRLRGQTAGLYGTEMGLAIYSTSTILIFAALVWFTARKMNVEYDLRSKAQDETRALNAELEARVAERTQTLEQQSAALSEQAALLDLAQDAIVVRDMRGRILFWNRGAEAIYGWRSDEVLGRNEFELLQAKFSEPLETIEAELLERGHWEGEATYCKRDGPCVFVVDHWALQRDADGMPIRVLGINNDITLRKDAEANLLRTVAELNRSNEELAQFAFVASHDLQEPLRMVASYTQLISKRYKGKLDAEADEFLAFALDGANRMQRLILDLLAYSRVGSKGKDLRGVSSEDALNQALRQLRGAIEDSGALVTHDSLPTVMADEMQLIQLLQNLVGNAIKYQSPGTPLVHISATLNSGNKWIFSVRDNGLGIDPGNFERIFGMFQRLHKREEFAGTGIGLAICKKIVERHGGNISVESQPGQGSVFRFALSGNEMNS
jgi:PAS domain S-box-containing protein